MARWFKSSGTAANNRYIYEPAKHPGGGLAYDGGRGVDTLRVVLTAAEWAKPAVQAELAAYANFLAKAPHNAKGEITGTFTFKVLNFQVTAVEKLELVVAGKSVNPLNDAPVLKHAIADKTIAEDSGAFSYKVPAGSFTDVDNAVLSYTAKLANGAALPTWLKFNPATQTFTGAPPHDFNGKLDIKVTASDGKLSASDTFRLNVTAVNDAPVVKTAIADQTINEDTGFGFTIPAGNFADVDSAHLTYTATLADGSPLPGTLAFDAATRTFSGSPPPNFNGPLDIKVTASDGKLTASDTFRLNVTAVNDAPFAADDVVATDEDTPVTIDVLANDSDVDGDTLTVASVTQGANGSVTVNPDGTLTYTPINNFHGADSFTYTTTDGSVTDTATVTVTVSPVNDAPVVADLPSIGTLQENIGPGSAAAGFSTMQIFRAFSANPLSVTFSSVANFLAGPAPEFQVQIHKVTGNTIGAAIYTADLYTAPTNSVENVRIDLSGAELEEDELYAMVLVSDNQINFGWNTLYADGDRESVPTPGGVYNGGPLPTFPNSRDLAFLMEFTHDSIDVDAGDSYVLQLSDLQHYLDSDSPSSAITFMIEDDPDHGYFALKSAVNTEIGSFSYAALAAGNVIFVADDNVTASNTFSFRVSDGLTESDDTIDIRARIAPDLDGFQNDPFHVLFQHPFRPINQDVVGGAGTELRDILGLRASANADVDVDFADDQITFSHTNVTPMITTVSALAVMTIEDRYDRLDAINGVALSINGTINNLTTADITFTENSIRINLGGVEFLDTSSFRLDIDFL